MTEAKTIPEDVMKAAEEALDNLLCNCSESCGGYDGVRKASIVDIAKAILAERERSQWQPIDTAPKGAKGIIWMMLAYGPEGDQSVSIGMRFHDKFYAAGVFYVGGPFDGRQHAFKEHEVQPTHWMPLPEVPA